MKVIQQHVRGRLFSEGGAGTRWALQLNDAHPQAAAADSLYLRFALVTLGPETPILPAFILDDWGKEIRSLAVYEWLRENGNRFPRSEVFGYTPGGTATQCFVRELDLVAKLPCYVCLEEDAPAADGRLLSAIIVPGEGAMLQPGKRPSGLARPLRSARVSWWTGPPALAASDFTWLSGS